MNTKSAVLGIDVGGTNVKGALVDINTGQLQSEKITFPTSPSTPEGIAHQFAKIVKQLDYQGPIGCGFPAVVKNGTIHTAANIDDSWIGTDSHSIFEEASKCPVFTLNDADAAGMAEMKLGAEKDHQEGAVLLITIGTGLGSALFYNGQLYPNTELGHIEFKGMNAEHYASGAVIKREGLELLEWAERFNEYLLHVDFILRPDFIILGGGVCTRFDEFKHLITVKTPCKVAKFYNDSGIIGAAMFAHHSIK